MLSLSKFEIAILLLLTVNLILTLYTSRSAENYTRVKPTTPPAKPVLNSVKAPAPTSARVSA
jgi:hypothetical protein